MTSNSGFITLIITLIIGLLVISYFGINLQGIVESPIGQSNFQYITNGIAYVWNNYLARPFDYLWNFVFINLLWNSFIENLQRVKDGSPTQIQELTPTVNLSR